MTPRERVLKVLNRQTADVIPLDIGGTDCSGIHVIPYHKLRAILKRPPGPIPCACLTQLVAEVEPDVQNTLQTDVDSLVFRPQATKIWKTPFGLDLVVPQRWPVTDLPDGSSEVRNAQGVVTARRAAGAYYFDPVSAPLAGITSARDLDRYEAMFDRWDYPAVFDEPLDAFAARARKQYQATSRAVVAWWQMHYLQAGQLLRGYEQFFVDLLTDPDLAQALLQKLHQVYCRRVETFLGAFGDALDIVFLTDDLGTQQASLISPDLYKRLVYPYVSELVGLIKARGKKVIMHSCGAVSRFIPFFIEMGVDALNPVQVSAAGMNPRDLVREFGRDLAFWGGGCDTQHALNAADPDVVRADVRRRFREFGPQAHWVFTQVHNVQYDVPPENILTLRDEFWKLARG